MVGSTEGTVTWLLLGASGQLGLCLQQVLTSEDIPFVACAHAEVDITKIEMIKDAVVRSSPSVVVNLAAWTDVDGAEGHREESFLINAKGAENVALVAADAGIPLVHISTDYVFDGMKRTPYLVTDATNPLSAYGATKLEGERLVQRMHPNGSWIVRTAWLYSPYGKNFARTIARKGLAGDNLSVVHDSFGQPTSAMALAHQLVQLVRTNPPAGIFHGTNKGTATWCEFAEAIVEPIVERGTIAPVSSTAFPTTATRPQYSVLDHSEWNVHGMSGMPHWKDSLRDIHDAIIDSVRDSPK